MFEVEYFMLSIILLIVGFCCCGYCRSRCQTKCTKRCQKEKKKTTSTDLKKRQRKELVFIIEEVRREIKDLADTFPNLQDREIRQQWLATQLHKLQGTDNMVLEENIYDAVTDLPDNFSNTQYSESTHITQENLNENMYKIPRFNLTPMELRTIY